MDIVVCVKQVPATAEVDLIINEAGTGIKTEGLVQEMNEWDEYALEEALLIRERLGGTVTAITMGPEGADAVLRRCLAKGVDRAIWLKDEQFEGGDAYVTAKVLHAAIKKIQFDLVFTGAQADDDGYSAVGGILAELLQLEYAHSVKKIIIDDILTVHRELEGGLEEAVELPMPALLTVQTGINEPRYVSIMGIRKARKKEITTLSLEDLELQADQMGESGSWMMIKRVFAPPIEKEPEILTGKPEEVAVKLVEVFRSRGLV